MDCTNARLILNFLRPGEIDDAERQALEAHLASCPDCAVAAQAEGRFDEVLGKAMAKVPVPAGLKGRILHKLTDRRAWRPWRWAAAAAAVLVIAGGTAIYFALDRRPVFDPTELVAIQAWTPESVESHFENEGLTLVAPREFNYNLLDSCEVAVVKGRRVAKLSFISQREKRPNIAHVYVLSAREFRLPDEVPEFGPGTHSFEIRNRDGDFPCVVIFNSNSRSLEPFLLFQGI